MKTWVTVLLVGLLVLLIARWGVMKLWAAPVSEGVDATAIQAIRQAPDPSAVVSALANGFSVNHGPTMSGGFRGGFAGEGFYVGGGRR